MAGKPGKRQMTAKEIVFADLIISGENDLDAFRGAYKTNKSSDKTATRDALKIKKRPHVADYIKKGRAVVAEKAQLTAEDLIKELEEARQLGKRELQPSAMVTATMGKAKLLGLDKVVVEIQNASELTPWSGIQAGIDK